jgi:DNA-binding YbaB/EbfC family protein|tara:strand:+ start:212 stop:535 length:324 start_codon:yes stop_codon:yes gene_type:complete
MFKGNMSKLLKQAQSVQQEIEKVQNQLSDMIIEGESGGGMVKVKVNGKQEVLELNIDETTMEEDKEVIEDLIVSALNKALSKAQIDSQEKMNSVAGGMMSGLKIPGM